MAATRPVSMSESQIINENDSPYRIALSDFTVSPNFPLYEFDTNDYKIVNSLLWTPICTTLVYAPNAILHIGSSLIVECLALFILPMLSCAIILIPLGFSIGLCTSPKRIAFIHCVLSTLQLPPPILNIFITGISQFSVYLKMILFFIAFIYLWHTLDICLSAIYFYQRFSQQHRPKPEDVYLRILSPHSSDEASLDDEAYSDDALGEMYRHQPNAVTETDSSSIQEVQEEHCETPLRCESPATQVIRLHFAPKFRWRSRGHGSHFYPFSIYTIYVIVPTLMVQFVANTCLMTHFQRV
ncbi:hypothetical protein GGI43DRAFT_233202 [Trichoderma evansii]